MLKRRNILKGIGALTAAGSLGLPLTRSLAAQPSLDGVIMMPPGHALNGKNFQGYNAAYSRTPAMRALCETSQGVVNALRWARETGTSFAVRSTGHCFAGHSQHSDMVIDTSRLDTIGDVTSDARIVVGAGARTGAVQIALARAGLALPTGTYESVGIAGSALGGGLGHFARLGGLLADRLKAVRLVTADGEMMEASDAENNDLFWACRGGGGGSLGVVTQMEFAPVPIVRLNSIDLAIAVPASEASRIVHNWQFWAQSLPRETTTHIQLSRHSRGKILIAMTGFSTEPDAALERNLAKLFGPAHVGVVKNFFGPDPTAVMMKLFGVPHYVAPGSFYSGSDFVNRPVSHEGIAAAMEAVLGHPSDAIRITLEALGGAVADTGENDSAYPHRKAIYAIHFNAIIRSFAQRSSRATAIKAATTTLAPYVTGGKYVNYPEPRLENFAHAYWGKNLERLKTIKRKYDPKNVFRHAQSIPLK